MNFFINNKYFTIIYKSLKNINKFIYNLIFFFKLILIKFEKKIIYF